MVIISITEKSYKMLYRYPCVDKLCLVLQCRKKGDRPGPGQ